GHLGDVDVDLVERVERLIGASRGDHGEKRNGGKNGEAHARVRELSSDREPSRRQGGTRSRNRLILHKLLTGNSFARLPDDRSPFTHKDCGRDGAKGASAAGGSELAAD